MENEREMILIKKDDLKLLVNAAAHFFIDLEPHLGSMGNIHEVKFEILDAICNYDSLLNPDEFKHINAIKGLLHTIQRSMN